MQSFTNRLTNGIFFPSFKLENSISDDLFKMLLKYLTEFVDIKNPIEDIRNKIKKDFNLLENFNGYKQTQAFLKIKKTLEEAMEITTKNWYYNIL